ncbi:MAG: hypothetical protein V7L05_12975 [Nostoc sp.]|uniref:hypothetical protein n=1 Tax=Nostoc sp. TaxID=1180 RepID=UPI002FFB6234
MILMLFTVLMLGSCGPKPEKSTSTTPQTPTAVTPPASPNTVKLSIYSFSLCSLRLCGTLREAAPRLR